MKRAIISDIHGNLEALNAVLSHIENQGASEIICLGDIIGLGPYPAECLDLVMEQIQVCLLGNHEQAVLYDPEHLSGAAIDAVQKARSELDDDSGNYEARLAFLDSLPRTHCDGDWLYVHGSPRGPVNEYVFPEDIYNKAKMDKLFDLVPRGCFQ